MNHAMRAMICLLLVSSFVLHPSSFLRADGGTVRLSEQKGNYRITVFTAPTPLRAGPVDISVFVQEAATAEPASDVRVTVKTVRRGSPGAATCQPATTEAATNKLYHAAIFDLPEPGRYAMEVSIDGALGAGAGIASRSKRPNPCRHGWQCGHGSVGRSWPYCSLAFINSWSDGG